MSTPSLAQWRIGVILRGLREERGMSIREAANMLGTNRSRLERVEKAGNQKVDPGTVTGWAFKYGASEQVIHELDTLAMRTRDIDSNGWESIYTTMPKWFTAFLTLECEAATIDSYESEYIPGLLQIEEYMDAAAAATPFMTTSATEEARRLKVHRQKLVFDRPPGKLARMRFIISEACLMRIRRASFYEAQVARILKIAGLESVEVYILPMDYGLHASMTGSFKLMAFNGPYTPELLYLETVHGARYIDERHSVSRAREVFSDTLTHVTRAEEYLSNAEQ
ncbi:helix-turn-helix transcriptional regulator [Glycomyces halotolerans]